MLELLLTCHEITLGVLVLVPDSIANCNWNFGFDNILLQRFVSVKSYITDVVKQKKVIKTLIKCVEMKKLREIVRFSQIPRPCCFHP